MISIIISSTNDAFLKKVTQNIAETIGVAHEIISFNNSTGENGLCKLYNRGARKAKYEIVCFMHEDVEFKTLNWGHVVTENFARDPELGLVGLAGSSFKSAVPSGWHSYDIQNRLNFINIIQGYKRASRPDMEHYLNPKQEKLSQVVCVDGVWLCTRKQIALEFPFDEETLTGFHGYDIDYSLSVNQKYKVAVTFEILIKHLSEGDYNYFWLRDIIKVHNKWNHVLPVTREPLNNKYAAMLEKKAFRSLLLEYSQFLTLGESLKILHQARIWRFDLFTHLKLYLTIVKQLSKRGIFKHKPL